ncbi:ribonuclease VapC51 [Paractinoplanes deccanensis]|uniref:Ribonuclease VapC n=1 Tax=Paractinoplanes deccanensis TaxID=113561 RepID=A0ABQ3Y6A8_9ACTN|nr:PIN domain nuclease [Actinoplanes deccanensis]GID75524.1 ribonuclease VapC51 [Actinoplanes deccanensis]
MKAPSFLVDTSAFYRLLRNPELQAVWQRHMRHGLLAVCEITELEIFHGARSRAHRDSLEKTLQESYRWIVMPESVWPRAKRVQQLLVDAGSHRSAGPVDLLAAAAAEEHGMVLLHYDADFHQIAAVTGQDVHWVAERGSIN